MMSRLRLGLGFTAVAIALVVAAAAYACTIVAADPFHDFQFTPTAAQAGTATEVDATGYCDVQRDAECGGETGTDTNHHLSYVACPTGPGDVCELPVPTHDHDQPCDAADTDLTNTSGTRERRNTDADDFQIVTGTGTMPSTLAVGRYIICHSYKSPIMYNVFTFV